MLAGALFYDLATPTFAQVPVAALPRLLEDEDIVFIEEMQRANYLFFVEQADPSTGQVLDRAINKTTGTMDSRFTSSIAATGFGLTALCIADSRSYEKSDRIKKQVLTTLQFHLDKMPHEHGFFYHFNDVKTGKPLTNSEVSSIDTSILLCGILTCRAYFDDAKIKDLATQIYNRVDWPWMLNGGTTFSQGWRPATGFISYRWDHYAEMMMLYLLAIGSPTHPVSPECWSAFTRPRMKYSYFDYISGNASTTPTQTISRTQSSPRAPIKCSA